MECSNCGAQAQSGQRFCGQCGHPLALVCPSCGVENPGDHRFCGSCGSALGAAPAPAPPAKTPVVAERRVVSVLFVDLVGFTSFSEHRDPEEVRSVITRYFDLARDVIERFGGTIDKFIGDAVMAWWGATTSQEDDAERAVRAGLEVVDGVASLGDQVGVEALAARAGVMTGEVSVSPGGNEKGLLLGDLVNSTSRLQSLADPGSVYVGETTAGLIGKAIEVAPAGAHQVKGKDEPILASRVVRVLSERGGRGRVDILEPPFVGRTAELRLLKDVLHATGREGRARLVSLVGQAGIGKSRLIWEFQKYVDGLVESIYWHEGRSPAYGDGLALWALGEMIRGRAGIQETDSADVTASRLSESVATYIADPERRTWVEERLAALLGLGDSAGRERTELFAAARAFFEGIAENGTTVLVFEDLHSADPSLLEFIEELPDWSQNHPILVVTMARPDLLDRRPDWGTGRRGFASMYLGPLSDEEMAELVAGVVPGIPEAAVARIVTAAGGVPLFAVEMLRMLIADGRVVIGDGGVSLVGDLDELEVPSSVQAVVAARLDRLPAEDREMVRDAAVLGHSFTVKGLAALRDEPVDKVERRLGDLVRREILEAIRDPRSPERGQYQWVQSLLREVAYGRIARGDRHDLHLRVARYFRELGEPELAPVTAAHFVAASEYAGGDNAGLQQELAAALEAAIGRAQALHAHEQILSLVDTALPVVPEDLELPLRGVAAEAAVRLNDPQATDRHIAALMALAEAAGDPAVTHRVVALAGRAYNETRRSDRAVALLAPHLERYPDLASDPNLAKSAVYLARARMLLGEDDLLVASLADSALEAVERFGLVDEVADAMITRGTVLSARRPHQGMALLRAAVAICREHDLVETKLRGLINIGYASPEFEETVEASAEAFEEAKRVGDRNRATFVASNLVGSRLFLMDLDAAEAVLADPVLSHAPSDRVQRLNNEGELLLRKGDVGGARERLDRAREIAQQVSDPQVWLNIERVEALLASVTGNHRAAFETGRRHYRSTQFAPSLSVSIAVRGAAMEGDEEMVAEALEMARELLPGVFSTPSVDWAEAMLTLLRGEADEAVERADASLEWLAARKMRLPEFLLSMSMAKHLAAGHPARVRYADRAREIAERAGATGFVDWLDREVGESPPM